MANKEHLKWLEEGVESWNKRVREHNFFPDLRGADLRGVDLKGASLASAHLRDANLIEANLSSADLRDANLIKANLGSTALNGADLRGADLSGAIFVSVDFKNADVRTLYLAMAHNGGRDARYTNMGETFGLDQNDLNSMIGDSGTIIPGHLTRPDHWEVLPWHREDAGQALEALDTTKIELDIIQSALAAPILNAARIDFSITVDGIVAGTPNNIEIPQRLGTQDCRNRRDALISLARSTGADVNNRLGENCKSDLNAYADHLAEYDPINPYILEDLIAQIAADTADPMVSDGFDERLKTQLSRLGTAHREFMENCAPVAQNALNVINDAPLTRLPTREEVTEVLNRFIAAIEKADAATASVTRVLDDLKALNTEINNQVLLATSDAKKARLDATTEKETKNLATIIDRLYWRCREYANHPWTMAQDGAVIATLSGKTVPDIVNALIAYLEPIKKTLEQLLTALPPM